MSGLQPRTSIQPALSTFVPYCATKQMSRIDESTERFRDVFAPTDDFRAYVHDWQRSALSTFVRGVERDGLKIVSFDIDPRLSCPTVWAVGFDSVLIAASIGDYTLTASNQADKYGVYAFQHGSGSANFWWSYNSGVMFSGDGILMRRVLWPLLVNQALSSHIEVKASTFDERLMRRPWSQFTTDLTQTSIPTSNQEGVVPGYVSQP